jgi:glyoxylase-like metal-dependent hydrolase (beta-lactamase superfamily II)
LIIENSCFSLKIGAFRCQVISDGTIIIPGGGFLPLACLLIQTGDHNILIDTGRGAGNEPLAGKLVENLQKANVRPAEIDKIVITHAHYDHVGGIIDSQGWAVFPKARYIIHQKEMDYWMPRLAVPPRSDDDIHDTTGKRNIWPVKDRFDPAGSDKDFIKGMKYVLVPGHTPGNSMVELISGSAKLLCIGDVMHDLGELTQPDFLAKFDLMPEEANLNRIKTMSQIADEEVLVFGGHFPFPGLGYIEKHSGILTWKPREKQA